MSLIKERGKLLLVLFMSLMCVASVKGAYIPLGDSGWAMVISGSMEGVGVPYVYGTVNDTLTIELDKTFEEREVLNTNIVASINEAATPWGVQVLRYEIKDIEPPRTVLDAMERQMKAEREKRAVILESEGERQSAINVAEGQKAAIVLAAEADKEEQILRAEGEAQAIIAVANAQAQALDTVGQVAKTVEGQKAIQLDLAESAIQAKAAIARESSVVLLSDEKTGASNIVAEAMTIINSINKNKDSGAGVS